VKLHLVTVGKRMPAWITSGFNEFNMRLPAELRLNLIEITPAIRGKSGSIKKAMKEENKSISAVIPKGSLIVALDEKGKQFNSIRFSARIGAWLQHGRDVSFIVGGADGLDDDFKKTADEIWSLSSMTLPHALARVVLVEQVYRAWTIMNNHPYHRG
jgi:23S rRNA (pseudouridine1915-N3)-methyltransferase